MVEDANEINEASNCRINNSQTTSSKSFEFKTKVMGSTSADNNTLDTLLFH